ncbi:MAG TPA: ATP cone domain-containing protein [Candidatus Saccharimonadales bacterium]|nr:ATP cone domain-containing protein [Candidatus Saccharimonadales bacterium]
MVCPKCHSSSTKVYNSRQTKGTNQTWRRRRCLSCNFVFSTREYIEAEGYLKVLKGTQTEPFSRARLLLSLARACEHCSQSGDTAFHLLSTVENVLLHSSQEGIISVQEILATCLEVLQRFDTKAYLQYLATYPAILDDRDLKKLLKN